MSELKARRAYFSEDEYDKGAHKICAKVSDCGYDRRNDWWSYAFEDEVYLKSEADKVIAEKDAEIVELKEQVHDYALGSYVLQARAEKEVRHHKYKWCVAMARGCRLRGRLFGACGLYEKELWALKWHKRWLELAEKFKEAK